MGDTIKKICVIIFFSIAFCNFTLEAQIATDVNIIPRPYYTGNEYNDTVNVGIKRVTHFVANNSMNGLHNDTIIITDYDKSGFKSGYITFQNNNRIGKFTCSFSRENGIILKKQLNLNGKAGRFTYYYDDKHIKQIYDYTLSSGHDTLHVYKTNYMYNANNRLSVSKAYQDKHITAHKEYLYNGSNLVQCTIFTNPDDKRFYSKYEYAYSQDNLLIESKFYQVRNTIIDTLFYQRFNYVDKQLTEEKYTISNSKEERQCNYTYIQTGNVKSFIVKKGKDFLQVDYEYNGKKQLTAKITTVNSVVSFKEKLVLLRAGSSTIFPYKSTEKYVYDKKGNLTQLSLYSGSNLLKQVNYKIDYY